MGIYSIPVVGESFKNADGSSRQRAIKRCTSGDLVLFVIDAANPVDQEALAVWTRHGQVGYVPDERKAWLVREVKKSATKVVGRVVSVGRAGFFRPYGIRIEALTGPDYPRGADLGPILSHING